jgi:hypothetical protein
MLLVGLIAVGLAEIVAGSLALRKNVRHARAPGQRRLAVVLAFAVGLALAAGSLFVVYPYGDNARIVGFPFPAAAWERQGDRWRDFVGLTTLPFTCANALFAFLLPHLFLWALRKRTG